jgi:cytoskeletal protein RodZ
MTDAIIPAGPEDCSDASCTAYPDLKTLREAKGLSLKDIFETTRISTTNLMAIEDGQFQRLPSPAYARPFIRSYAQAVGIESDVLLAAYEAHLQSFHAPLREKKNSGIRQKGGKHGKWIIWLLCAGIAVIAIVLLSSRDHRPSPEVVPAHPPATTQVDPAPAVSAPTPSVPTEPAPAVPAPTPPAPTEPAPAVPALMPPGIKPEVRPEAPKPVSDKKYHLFVEAREEVWLRIRRDENQSEQMLLTAGQTLERTSDEPFKVDIGNAGGIAVTFQGKPVGSVGKRGQVVHLRFPED